MNSLESQIRSSLARVLDPELNRPITDLGMLGAISGTVENFEVQIKLTVEHCPMKAELESSVKSALVADFPGSKINIQLAVMTQEELADLKQKLRGKEKTNPFLDSPTRVILVGSGKGGVGKSTITANLAVGLANLGFQVGMIDADIFGFSLTKLMGTSKRPTRLDDMMLPPMPFGVKLISIGMFLDSNEPVSWRGPMLHKAIEQFLTDVYWGDLDFLIIDMPPGTGDVAISIGQLLPRAKYLAVTTAASDASFVAARSAMAAFKAGQEIIGVVENFSWIDLPDGSKQYPFGQGGGNSLAQELSQYCNREIKLISQLPLSEVLAKGSANGIPLLATKNSDLAALKLNELVEQVAQIKLDKDQRQLKVKLSP